MRARIATPRLLVSSASSGSGKTVITSALLFHLRERGLRVAALKCGPDYLDPTFHRVAHGVPSANVDLFMSTPPQALGVVADTVRDADIALFEGAMGMYDGVLGTDGQASAYEVARLTRTPVVAVLDARGVSDTLGSVALGIKAYRADSGVAGYVLNRASRRVFDSVAGSIERACALPVLGYVPPDESLAFGSRHLGLVGAGEVADVADRLRAAGERMAGTVDIEALMDIARGAEAFESDVADAPRAVDGHPLVAIASDEAFSFTYRENVDILRRLGCEVTFFSPLHDDRLPGGTSALVLSGGYPELHARELSENTAMLEAVRGALETGMPAIAECGGYLYLQQSLEDDQGRTWPMVGHLPGRAVRGTRLSHFGYVRVGSERPSCLGWRGLRVHAHEFHRWQVEGEAGDLLVEKADGSGSWTGGTLSACLYAGFPHLYFPGCPDVARGFAQAASQRGGCA